MVWFYSRGMETAAVAVKGKVVVVVLETMPEEIPTMDRLEPFL